MKNMHVCLPWLAECSKNNFDLELKRSLSEVKALILEEWPSATSPRTQNPVFPRFSILLAILSHNHWPLNVTSGIAWTTNDVDYFNPTTIKAMIHLYRSPSLLALTYSPAWYWAALCKYISSIIKMRSVKISPFSRKTFKAFNESNPPCCIYSKVIWKALEVFLITVSMLGEMCFLNEAGNGGLPVGFWSSLCFNSSSKTCWFSPASTKTSQRLPKNVLFLVSKTS